ncbi:LOW QUALITY PROTEIN: uncharacterized protein ppp1r36 [Spinachia spinachia]
MSSDSTEWLLHACLYSFFCYVAWVTFGRGDLKDIQEEVGRLLYSDTINTASRTGSDGESRTTFTAANGTVTARPQKHLHSCFGSNSPTEGVVVKSSQTNGDIKALQLRSECVCLFPRLAAIYTLSHRWRQNIRKGLSHAHLHAYRSSVMRRQGNHITTDDVKRKCQTQSPVRALVPPKHQGFGESQYKHILNIFVALEMFRVPETYGTCYLTGVKSSIMCRSKGLDEVLTALLLYLCCFFKHKSLKNAPPIFPNQPPAQMMQHLVCRTTQAVLYRVFDLIGAGKGSTSMIYHLSSTSQRRAALSRTVNQRSPLMVSLLPSPKERLPHLFPGNRAGERNKLLPEQSDTEALTEELQQQLASVSVGILGKPFGQFNRSTLIPSGEQNKRVEEDDPQPVGDIKDSEDHAGVHV